MMIAITDASIIAHLRINKCNVRKLTRPAAMLIAGTSMKILSSFDRIVMATMRNKAKDKAIRPLVAGM